MRSGWKSTVLALICGIFVGSQLNESVRVMDVYFATTSKLDAEYSDLPLEVQREPRSKNPAPRRMEEEPKSSVSGKEPTSHSSKAKGETAEMTSNSRKDGGSVLSNKLTSDTPPSLPIEENDQPKANDAIADEVAPEQPNVPIERKPLLKTTQKRGGTGESKRASSTAGPQKVPRSDNQTMNACLFIMDDTIRLSEWLAYHYTVLPLGHLIIAIDPKSKRTDKITEILDMWRDYIEIDAYYNDTFLTLDPYEGWGRAVWGPNNRPRGWFKNKKGYSYRSQAHKRRQNFFSSYCFGQLWEKEKREWTILTDTDEFLVFNYRDAETEDSSKYDSETLFKTKEDIDKERESHLSLRDQLPKLNERVTIASYMDEYRKTAEKTGNKPASCWRIPGLTFSSQESNSSEIEHDVPEGIDGSYLMTLRHRKHAAKDGSFSKAMLNLHAASSKGWFEFGSVLNVHTPNRRMCGRTTKQEHTGSGADYISSLLRLHHYKAGTIESYLERAGDWRGGGLWRFYSDRNMKPVGENSDVTPWFSWFVDKVGVAAAKKLLLDPLREKYEEIGNLRHIKEAKEAIGKLVPSLADENTGFRLEDPIYYKRTNKTMGGCMYILNDSLRLMEWLAYHYTTLPLDYLILGLDPASTREKEIRKVIEIWQDLIKIELYTNSSWMDDLGEEEGWKRRIRPRGENVTLDWVLWKNTTDYTAQAHKRRQNTFVAKCLANMNKAGREWVVATDSDEFVTFNHVHEDENPFLYDSVESHVRTKADVDKEREKNAPIRRRLPKLQEHVTVADFIDAEGKDQKCFRMPALNFSAYQDRMTRVELPPTANLLSSLLQHKTGRKEGRFCKTIVDVSKADAEVLDWARVDSVHNPSRRLCKYNGRLSGTDYIAAVLRVHHYVAGTVEQYAERGKDFRGNSITRYLTSRHFEPVGENHDIDYWIDWFVYKVGMKNAEKLLFKPITITYKELAHVHAVKALKTEMQQMEILPKNDATASAINDEGEEEEG